MSSRYNGPGANLRGGQARVPRPTRSRTDSRTADSPSLVSCLNGLLSVAPTCTGRDMFMLDAGC